MELTVVRRKQSNRATVGKLYINGKFECYTLEDKKQVKKVRGETRIPPGRYEVRLKPYGGFYNRYSRKFGAPHPMLNVKNVPGFEHILIHCGNYHSNTEGCLLVGKTVGEHQGDLCVWKSTKAYKRLYRKVTAVIGEKKVFITYLDEDDNEL